jgi:hypothetical protein
MKNHIKTLSLFLTFNFLVFEAFAEEYSLLNPVPESKLRPMITERPSNSNSAFTIDSGHLQIESSLFGFKKNNDNGVKTFRKTAFESTTLRLGITQSTELSIVSSPFIWKRTKDSQDNSKQSINAFGDVLLRVKHNFFGNDSSSGGAFAAIPYLKIPTNTHKLSNDYYEGGVQGQYDYNLGNSYSLGYTLDVGAIRKSDNSSYTSSLAQAFDIGKSFTEKTSGYVEFYSFKSFESSTSAQNTLNFGLIYQLTKNCTIDFATNFGVSKAADDFQFITGGSYRF